MLCLRDFEEYAEMHLDRKAWAFFSQGAEREFTLRDNLRCFTRYTLVPRMLRNVPVRDLSVTVLGERLSIPVGIAPSAYQRLAHPEGEIAASRAASDVGTVYTLSTVSTTSLEDVARSHSNNGPLWMQIYVFKDREGTKELIQRAEIHGYKALVLTVDSPVVGLQLKHWRDGLKLPPHMSAPNLERALKRLGDFEGAEDHTSNVKFLEDNVNWNDVAWIKSISKLPLVLKGILTVEDALEAVKYGASAVWVSNHGGRQLDGVSSALDVLPKISSALAGTGCEVYVDGGVRWGSDVLKALALGARAVFIGRPALWGLNHSGQAGVRSVLEILKTELDRAMHLAGCKDISDIGPHLVEKRHFAKF